MAPATATYLCACFLVALPGRSLLSDRQGRNEPEFSVCRRSRQRVDLAADVLLVAPAGRAAG
jgi:hypothetical protein